MTPLEHDDPHDPLTHALAIAAAGLRVLPIKPGEKRPPLASWQHAATVESETLRKWWTGLYRNYGVGIAMGLQPDGRWLFALDVDEHDPAQSGSDTLAVLEQLHGRLPETVRSITSGGGIHLIFDAGDVEVTNGPAGVAGPGLDVRGSGGQIAVAPTVHPVIACKKCIADVPHPLVDYEWEAGHSLWEHEIALAPAWLLELVGPKPEPEPAVTNAPVHSVVDGDATPADWLRGRWDWSTELAAAGWTIHRRHHDSSSWTRPGKDRREGASGVLHEPDGPFVVFTTDASATTMWRCGKVSRDGSCVSLSPLQFHAAHRYGGDVAAASRAVRADMPASVPVSLSGLIRPTVGTVAPQEGTVGTEPDDATADDWHRADLRAIARAIRTGTHERIAPTVLDVAGGEPLFYPGRVNSLFGESGGFKTYIALAAAAQELQAGRRVLMVDYEDDEAGVAERLVLLGLTDDEIGLLDYRNPSTALALGVEVLAAEADECSLVLLDSTGEAMAAGGTNPNADEEVARWFTVARRLCRLPGRPALVVLDHVPKSTDAPSLFGIGSQRKRAAITGASYRVDAIKEPAKGRDGKLKLTVAKDRLGNRAKGTTAAMVDVHSVDADGALTITVSAPRMGLDEDGGEVFRPTVYMERVSRWLELHPGSKSREIHDGVQGKRTFIDEALAVLVAEEWVAIDAGERGAKHHRVTRQYRESDDPKAVDNSPASLIQPTAAHRGPPRPDCGPEWGDTPETTAAPAPLPYGAGPRSRGHDDDSSTGTERAAVNTFSADPLAPLSILDGITHEGTQ